MSDGKLLFVKGSNRIELEGSIEFIDKKLAELLPYFETQNNEPKEENSDKTSSENETKTVASSLNVTLKTFFDSKSPKNSAEAIACVLLHAKKFKSNEELSTNEIRQSLVQVKYRPPSNVGQSLVDCRNKYGYVQAGTKKSLWQLTHEGETLVEIDLPR